MRIAFHSPSFSLTAALRAYTQRRLLYATGHFEARIAGLSVQFVDSNGPRGGADKVCQLEVRLTWGERLRIEDVDADLYAAIDRAAHRLRRAVASAVARHRMLRTRASGRRRQKSSGGSLAAPVRRSSITESTPAARSHGSTSIAGSAWSEEGGRHG